MIIKKIVFSKLTKTESIFTIAINNSNLKSHLVNIAFLSQLCHSFNLSGRLFWPGRKKEHRVIANKKL